MRTTTTVLLPSVEGCGCRVVWADRCGVSPLRAESPVGYGHVLPRPLHGMATRKPTNTTTLGSDATYPPTRTDFRKHHPTIERSHTAATHRNHPTVRNCAIRMDTHQHQREPILALALAREHHAPTETTGRSQTPRTPPTPGRRTH